MFLGRRRKCNRNFGVSIEFSFLSLKIVFFLTFRLAASSEGKERKDEHYRDLRRLDINYRY